MNKFGKPSEEDFLIVSDVIKKMVMMAPVLVSKHEDVFKRQEGTAPMVNKLEDNARTYKLVSLVALSHRGCR